MVSGQLEDSLRHEIESYIEGRLSGVKQEIAALQSQLNEALSQLLDRQSEVQLDGGVAASIMEHLRAAHEEGIDLAASESARAKASSDMAIVKAAISEINEQDSQAGILKILVNRASTFAPRVAFFVVKGEQSIGWRSRGFEGTVGDNVVQQISFSMGADTAVGHAARSRRSWSGGPGSHSEDHIILNRLGDEPPVRIVAIPLVVRDRGVAVLYADSAELDADAINLEALETLVRVAGMAVELLAARSAPAKQPAASEPAEETSEAPQVPELPAEAVREHEPPAYVPVAEYDELTPVVEESAPAPEVIAAEYEVEAERVTDAEPDVPFTHYEAAIESPVETPAEALAETPVEPPIESPAPVVVSPEPPAEVRTGYQAESPIESPTPVVAPPVPPAIAEAPSAETTPATPRRRYGADVELPIEVANDEERRLHSDARRFARLLVSEVKLYNEQKVTEGRSRMDLYQRLREDIDRSRQMYDKRVKPEVAQRYDYFHHELVNTLAEGDAAKLGSEYPGATVSA
ncbi:MAG: hypothetical protein H7Z16_03880 [Pyrinomonadaceae bacterium]|nr:hypothetical protein [Pyrinomonadaceae bacterium]